MDQDITEMQFIEMLQQGLKVFHRICLEDASLKGWDLSSLTFTECLFSIDFSGSNLESTQFIDCNLKTCFFTNCILTHAVFIGNSLDATDFSGAQLDGITFKDYTYHSIVLTDSHLAEMII
ncbi:pentapeptide repeat-containing protein [Paenibacillus sp. FSL K6-1217]|uniref:pentapeptide repeat-containing protein n=1 Tax=Paenibacillus sp. FSL K6-1217 TaxID=2921466 RepID=UPI003254CFB8